MLYRRWISGFFGNSWKLDILHPLFSHAVLPNSYIFDSESAWKFSKILHEEVYMLEQVTTFEEGSGYSSGTGQIVSEANRPVPDE